MKPNKWQLATIFLVGAIFGYMLNKFSPDILRAFSPNLTNIKSIGSHSAPVTMIEYSDFECPFCRDFYKETFDKLRIEYVETGKLRIIFKDLPLISIHKNAFNAALAANCAAEQNQFWIYHDELFENQSTWANQNQPEAIKTFKQFASNLSLNTKQFNDCLDNEKYKSAVTNDIQTATKLKLTGTPSFIINDEIIQGNEPYSILTSKIEKYLN